jgi:hypothetical protein
LEEKLASTSYGASELAEDFRKMCDAAVLQLFKTNSELAQKASDLLDFGNSCLRRLEKGEPPPPPPPPPAEETSRAPTLNPEEPFGGSFWDVSLPGVTELLTVEARRVGFAKRQLEDLSLASQGPRTAGVKRKISYLEKEPAVARPQKSRFSSEMQAVVAGFLDTVVAPTAEEAAKVCPHEWLLPFYVEVKSGDSPILISILIKELQAPQ